MRASMKHYRWSDHDYRFGPVIYARDGKHHRPLSLMIDSRRARGLKRALYAAYSRFRPHAHCRHPCHHQTVAALG